MAQPWVFSYSMLDGNGVKAADNIFYKPTSGAITVTQLIADWGSYGTLLDAASGAQIVAGTMSLQLPADGAWKSTPSATNDVSDVINMNFGNGADLRTTAVLLMQNLAAQIVAGKVVLTETALAALIAGILAGGTSGKFTSATGEQLTALKDAFSADRKHRRQLRNKSISYPTA